MKRSFSSRRSTGTSVTRGKKRQKQEHQYSTREINWEEQRALGGKFEAVGEGAWPVRRIVGQRGVGKKLQYQVEWQPHPHTHESFKPQWVQEEHVNDDSIAEWEEAKEQRKENGRRAAEERTAARRVIPSSSGEAGYHVGQEEDDNYAYQAQASPFSGSRRAEEGLFSPGIRINLPPVPHDKAAYETVDSSQLQPSSQDNAGLGIQARSEAPVSGQQPVERSRIIPNSQPSGGETIVDESSPHPESGAKVNLGGLLLSAPDRIESSQSSSLSARDSIALSTAEPHAEAVALQGRQKQYEGSRFIRPTEADNNKIEDIYSSAQIVSGGEDNDEPEDLASHSAIQSPETNTSSPSTPGLHSGTQAFFGTNFPQSLDELYSPADMASNEVSISRSDATDGYIKSPLAHTIHADEVPDDEPLFQNEHQDFLVVAPEAISAPLIVHESIEDEPQSSTDTSQLLNSKGNSSQESLNNEREIETVDGVMIPALPIFGPFEYAVALPAEGKIKSVYDEIIKLKKKAIIRFISRKGSPGTSEISSKKTLERNEMQEMLSRLNDTTTHIDLGLPSTQEHLTQNPEASAAHAEYAGSKFVFLGYLVDQLKKEDCSLVVFAQEGNLQDLIEEYLTMKQVTIRRWSRPSTNQAQEVPRGFSVDILTTQQDKGHMLPRKPALTLAFDVSFATSDPQWQLLQRTYGDDLPVVHLLVANSSEHVERCVPVTFTSNIRLKVVVRTTYLAASNLGGDVTYMPDDSDQPEGRPMDMGDLQRAVRKSPNRRLRLIADIMAEQAVSGELNEKWSLGGMPELKLVPFETPPRVSRAASRTPQPRNARSRTPQARARRTQTPVSRGTTPVGRKRLLEVDGENGAKRQRLTPVRDLVLENRPASTVTEELREARKQIDQLTLDLANARAATNQAQQTVQQWRDDHSELLRRYEQSTMKQKELHKANKKLTIKVTAMTEREETSRQRQANLRQQLTDQKTALMDARNELKAAGGDIANLEEAREEAREATKKLDSMEKSVKSTKNDFEFTRSQYQDASKRASDLASEVKDLEGQVENLKVAAGDSKRSLKAMNYEKAHEKYQEAVRQAQLEVRNRDVMIKRLQEENSVLKSRRGVQTRGSSMQPASSPGPRSRQASPAPGYLQPPTGSRASVLRNSER